MLVRKVQHLIARMETLVYLDPLGSFDSIERIVNTRKTDTEIVRTYKNRVGDDG